MGGLVWFSDAVLRTLEFGKPVTANLEAFDSDHAAVGSVRSRQVRQLQTPDTFPDAIDMAITFRHIDKLSGPGVCR
jgi:hypothetical protein